MADLFLKRNDDIEELIYKQDTRLNIGWYRLRWVNIHRPVVRRDIEAVVQLAGEWKQLCMAMCSLYKLDCYASCLQQPLVNNINLNIRHITSDKRAIKVLLLPLVVNPLLASCSFNSTTFILEKSRVISSAMLPPRLAKYSAELALGTAASVTKCLAIASRASVYCKLYCYSNTTASASMLLLSTFCSKSIPT